MISRSPRTVRLMLIVALAALAAVNAAMLVLWLRGGVPPREVHLGTADVGGAFELSGADGQPVSSRALLGRHPILIFGWTRDPGLSEPSLRVLEDALRRLGRTAETVVPIFIALDVERDGPQELTAFVAKAGSRARAAFGDRITIDALSSRYRLYQRRIADPALPGGYTIDQSYLYYVLKRDGTFGAAVPYTNDSVELAKEIAKMLH